LKNKSYRVIIVIIMSIVDIPGIPDLKNFSFSPYTKKIDIDRLFHELFPGRGSP